MKLEIIYNGFNITSEIKRLLLSLRSYIDS